MGEGFRGKIMKALTDRDYIALDGENQPEELSGICSGCEQECEVITIDEGIGWYDYCGQSCTDVQLEAASKCCELPAYFIEDDL